MRIRKEPEIKKNWDPNSEPLVTIVCTTFNQENYISQTIEGFLIQITNFSIEIIIHDDASTDNTSKIIKDFEHNYPNLIVPIYQIENQYSKKNISLWSDITFPKSRGKYIALCEGDDYWIDPYKLQKQVDFMEANTDYSMCFHNVNILYDKIVSEKVDIPIVIEGREYSSGEIFEQWIVPTASVLFRKSMFSDIHMKNSAVYYRDIILFLTLANNGRIWGFSDYMAVYRKHIGGISLKGDALRQYNHKKFILKTFTKISTWVRHKMFSKIYFGQGRAYYKEKRIGLALYNLLLSFVYNPYNFVCLLSKSIQSKVKKT